MDTTRIARRPMDRAYADKYGIPWTETQAAFCAAHEAAQAASEKPKRARKRKPAQD